MPDLLALVHDLRSGQVIERQVAARLLVHADLPRNVVTEEVRAALENETNPLVIRSLIAALQYAPDPDALPLLMKLASHPDPLVRFGVPDALASNTKHLAHIVNPLLELSKDQDRDVRWSAAFELAAWMAEPDTSTTAAGGLIPVHSRLRELAEFDPDPEIRAMAAKAVDGGHGE